MQSFLLIKVKNEASSLCLDTLQRDEKARNPIGVFHCQSGGSSAQVSIYTSIFSEFSTQASV